MTQEPCSLLVVEDNVAAGELLARCFRDRHHRVTVCRDGNHALALAGKERFDLVLLDILLPDTDGLEVLQALRHLHPATVLPVIMTTGNDRSDTVVRALELGANDYVTKPYDLPVLRARVQTHLSIKRMVEQTARLERSLTDAYGRIKDDLQAAARVQKTLLPQAAPDVPGLRFAWAFQPCEELAGDTFNVFQLDRDHVGVYLLDVSGHGVAAALLAVQLSRVLSPLSEDLVLQSGKGRHGRRPVPPAEVAEELNRRFPFDRNAELYSTLVYGILNCRTGEFRYVCAGHPGPAHAPRAGEPRILKVTGLPIGVGDARYKEHTLQLEPDDRLYLYSDGLTDALDADRHRFGAGRLLAALGRGRGASLEDSLNGVLEDVQAWQARPRDDVSVVAVEWSGAVVHGAEGAPRLEQIEA
jgi:sigma-B regulation protein RsbU (phosphoserine phosphatase)